LCVPAIDAALTALVKKGEARARAEELRRLEAGKPSKRLETRARIPGNLAERIGVIPKMDAGATQRLPATIDSPIAARRMEAYVRSQVITLTVFAGRVRTTDRTLRAFRKTGRVRRDIF